MKEREGQGARWPAVSHQRVNTGLRVRVSKGHLKIVVSMLGSTGKQNKTVVPMLGLQERNHLKLWFPCWVSKGKPLETNSGFHVGFARTSPLKLRFPSKVKPA